MPDSSSNIATTARKASPKKPSPYIGVTRDGVRILRPKFPPKNFTEQQLREAVAKALGKSA